MKKSYRNSIFILITFMLLAFINGDIYSEDIQYTKISQDIAKSEMDSNKDIILLDVRTRAEYDEEHISNSVLIPLNELKGRAEKELKDKNQKIFIICRSGNRSKSATNILNSLGYKNAYDIGGIITWKYGTVKK